MRTTNCRNVQREIEETGSADFLSVAAMSHLEACAACATLLRQQTKLQALVSSLGTVEAPGDFDFRLRARLAAEKPGRSRPLPFASLSFGLRSAAVATILLLLGSAFVFLGFRTRPDNPVVAGGGKQVAPQPTSSSSPTNPLPVPVNVKPDGPELAQRREGIRRRRPSGEIATYRDTDRIWTRDQSGRGATVLRPDQPAPSYPTAAFPINASYQSLKVSVDNARGTSRTISLPSVSFGSQRTLSQNTPPFTMRGSW